MSTRVLITGSRKWRDRAPLVKALLEVCEQYEHPITIVHGGQRTKRWNMGTDSYEYCGADYLIDQIAKEVGLEVEVHLPDWDRYGKAAGPIRNQEMVDAGADVCLAFPMGASPGTRGCMAKAEAAGIPVINLGYDELVKL